MTYADPAFEQSEKVEYFWLCRDCSHSMTLRLDSDGKVTTQALAHPRLASSRNCAIISRHQGMLLRSVDVGGMLRSA